jgi:hypothetical protein
VVASKVSDVRYSVVCSGWDTAALESERRDCKARFTAGRLGQACLLGWERKRDWRSGVSGSGEVVPQVVADGDR